jgi:hypothetical protein
MAMPILSDFRAMFPTLTKYSDEAVNFWLGQADPFFDQDRWDDVLVIGVLNWVAHQLVLVDANAAQGLTDDGSVKKVGDISKTRDSELMNKQADNPYYRTPYGQQYLYYQSYVGAGATVVGSDDYVGDLSI